MMRRVLHLPKNKRGAETDGSGHCLLIIQQLFDAFIHYLQRILGFLAILMAVGKPSWTFYDHKIPLK